MKEYYLRIYSSDLMAKIGKKKFKSVMYQIINDGRKITYGEPIKASGGTFQKIKIGEMWIGGIYEN